MTAIEFQYKLVDLQGSLMRFAYSLTLDKTDAEDLVQDTCLNALKYSDKFVYESNLKAWTYTILKNIFINNYRRSTRINTYHDSTKDGFYLNSNLISNADNPDSVYCSKELEKSIDALDDDFRLPFKMHHDGFKYKEIAEKLDLNIGTVKSRIFFARKRLIKQVNL